MNPYSYEEFANDPELRAALIREARRARAEAVHRLIILPVIGLFRGQASRSNLRHPRKAGGAPA